MIRGEFAFVAADTDLERPVCFTRSIQRHCGQALPTFAWLARISPHDFRRRKYPSQTMLGDSAPRHGFTAAFGARIDLLFTMSDITRASAEAENART
jgi:hypothetical protein